MIKWEYKMSVIDVSNYTLEVELNNLGEDGWEVSFCRMPNPWTYEFICKRQKAAN